jgi:hypothetical protein
VALVVAAAASVMMAGFTIVVSLEDGQV